MTGYSSKPDARASEALKISMNPSITEPDQLMSAMTDQNELAPTSNLGGFQFLAGMNQKIELLSKSVQGSQPMLNFTQQGIP